MKKLNNLKLEVKESPYRKHYTVDNRPLQTLDLVICLMSKVPTADMLLNENTVIVGEETAFILRISCRIIQNQKCSPVFHNGFKMQMVFLS